MPNYGTITNANQKGKTGGYKNTLYFSEVGDITTWQRPTATPSALGDKFKITTAHTWGAGKAANVWETKIGSVQHTIETGGDVGARELIHVARFEVLGDDASTLEQMVNFLNDNKVVWLKDADCLTTDSYVQLGDDCNPISASITFDSKTNNPEQVNGQKSYVVEIRTKAKFFYLAAMDLTA